MDDAASDCSYPLHDDVDIQGCIYYILEKLSCINIVEHILLYKRFIRSFNVVNFNVSSTKLMHTLNFLDMFSVSITYHYKIKQNFKTVTQITI
jgi:hypothetical protein